MLGLIIKREIRTLLSSRTNTISFIVMLVLIFAAGILGNIFNAPDESQPQHSEAAASAQADYVIGIEKSAESAADYVKISLPGAATEPIGNDEGTDWLTDAQTAQQQEGSDISYAVIAGTSDKPVVIFPNSSALRSRMGDALQQGLTYWVAGNNSNLTAAETAKAIGVVNGADIRILDLHDSTNLILSNPAGYFTAMVSVMFLAIAALTGLNLISAGIVEEKSSRVVEIILSSVRPRTLLFGKVIGIGTIVIGQLICYVIAARFALHMAHVSIPFSINAAALWTVLWALVGFLTYALIAGSFAATASRQEDLAPITGTITFLTFVPVYGGFYLVSAMPEALVTKVLSFVPFFSSYMMPVRQAFGVASLTDQIIAFVIALAAIPLLTLFAGRIYRNSVLHSGKRLSVISAWKRNK